MKRIVTLSFIGFFFLTFKSEASSLVWCNSAQARLSRNQDCIGRPLEQFDLPALKLQFDDLEKIIQGSESSGGRIMPDFNHRPNGGIRVEEPTHHCDLKLLLDGGKRISWLLKRSLDVVENSSHLMEANLWQGGLVEGNSLEGTIYEVKARPQWGLDSLKLSLKEKDLTLCFEEFCASSFSREPIVELSTGLKVKQANNVLIFKATCHEL